MKDNTTKTPTKRRIEAKKVEIEAAELKLQREIEDLEEEERGLLETIKIKQGVLVNVNNLNESLQAAVDANEHTKEMAAFLKSEEGMEITDSILDIKHRMEQVLATLELFRPQFEPEKPVGSE